MRLHSLKMFSLALTLTCGAAMPAFAQKTTPATQRVEIKQADRKITVKDHKETVTSTVTLQSIRVPATLDTATSIVLMDPNPLLFTYTWKDVKSEDSKDYAAVLSLAKLLKEVGGTLPAAGGTSAPEANAKVAAAKVDADAKSSALTAAVARLEVQQDALAVEQETLRTTNNKLSSTTKATERRSLQALSVKQAGLLQLRTDDIARTQLEIASLRREVDAAHAVLAEAVRRREMTASLAVAGLDDKWREDLTKALTEISTMADGVPPVLKQAVGDPEGAKKAAAILTASLEKHRKAIEDGYDAVSKALPSVLTAVGNGTADPATVAGLALIRTVEPDARKVIETLTAFQADAQKIGVPVTLGTVPYSATQTQLATVVIAKTKGNPNKDASTEGTYAFTIDPYSRVDISIAPAYIHSWIKNQPEASGHTLAAMITFAFRPEKSRVLVPGVNLGLSPKSKGLDFYFGLSVRISDLFQLGGGLSWSDVKDEGRDFKPGGYLLLSVDLLPKKK